ncbi:MAG: PD40 domain-containing protein [Acidobacteria bacterium]|nr:PD40 domain-containing protein [Acidobacteriota bacterium]
MRFTLRMAALAVVAGLTCPLFAQSTDRTDVAFHAARKKETVDGDLKGAIEAYKKLVQSGRNPAIAAKALVRMGDCYERLGDAEARKAYERVVREFGNQKEAVAAANARLAALAKDVGSSGVRVVSRSTPGLRLGVIGPSPDGRYLLQRDVTGKLLELRNLDTDKVQTLPRRGPAWNAAFSPDGRQVAYAIQGSSAPEVWIVGTDGARDRLLWAHVKDGGITIAGWSPDAKQVILQASERRKPTKLVAVSTAEGSATTLREGTWLGDLQLSPDGRYVSFTPSQEKPSPDEIRLFSLTDRSEVTVLRDMGTARDPRWTPDSSGILFLSDRRSPGKSWDLWLLRLSGGKPLDRPQLVKTDLGAGSKPVPLKDLTRDGAYFYQDPQKMFREILTTAFDPVTGKAVGSPAPLHPHGGTSFSPTLSHDGRRLAYFRGGSEEDGLSLVVRSVDTGEETSVSTSLRNVLGRLFPDGRSLLISTSDLKDGTGFYRMGTTTGLATLLKRAPVCEWFDVASDGKTIYYSRRVSNSRTALFVWNIETGEERELLTARGQGPQGEIIFHLSPDEKQLAISGWEGGEWFLELASVAGADRRTVLRASEPVYVAGWWPDGRYLLLESGPNYPGELQRVPVGGGERQSLGLKSAGSPGKLVVHPDGRRIDYINRPNKAQIWSLENFLPKPSK